MSSYFFEIRGRKNDGYINHGVGTSYNVSEHEDEDDVYAAASSFIWSIGYFFVIRGKMTNTWLPVG